MWFFFESYIHVVQHLICQFGLIWTMQIYNQQQREGKLQNEFTKNQSKMKRKKERRKEEKNLIYLLELQK